MNPVFSVEATGFEPATSASRTNIAMCYVVFFYFRQCYCVMSILLGVYTKISHIYKGNRAKAVKM